MPRYARNAAGLELLYPRHRSGWYTFCNASGNSGTNNALGNGTLRLTPWPVPYPITISRIGAEFTVAGEAASVFRIGVYAVDGDGLAQQLVLDAGSISTGTGDAGTVATGGTPGVYDITVNQYLPRGWYAVGGVVQAAPTTQPSMRVVGSGAIAEILEWGATMPGAGVIHNSYSQNAGQGALPANFVAAGGGTGSSSAPRLHVKVA